MALAPRLRFSLELLTAILAIVFLLASIISPDWIERTTGFAPDDDSGGFEWGLSLGAAAVFVIATWLAQREWRAFRQVGPSGGST